jgi:ribonucleoside-diphosphate reductase alpha chain
VTHKFAIAGQEAYLTVGLDEDDRPGEVFLKISKDGTASSGLVHAFCRALSLAFQYGLPLETAVDRFRGTRFEPSGPTTNPDIPHADSVLDYVARYLDLHFID